MQGRLTVPRGTPPKWAQLPLSPIREGRSCSQAEQNQSVRSRTPSRIKTGIIGPHARTLGLPLLAPQPLCSLNSMTLPIPIISSLRPSRRVDCPGFGCTLLLFYGAVRGQGEFRWLGSWKAVNIQHKSIPMGSRGLTLAELGWGRYPTLTIRTLIKKSEAQECKENLHNGQTES